MKNVLREVLIPGAERVVGRGNLARFARYLTNEIRRDGPNNSRLNGELLVQQCVLEHARKAIVFDVGANIGEWTLSLLNQSRAGGHRNLAVYAFEPCAATRTTLSDQLASHPDHARVTVHPLGMSFEPSTAILHVVGDGVGINSLHRPDDVLIDRTEQVEVTTLDEFSRQQGLTHISFVKIDTEGHDAFVLRGGRRLLEDEAIDVVQFEYNHRWILARTYLRDVFELLPPAYRLGKVTREGIEWYPTWHPELESFREGNYLVCHAAAQGWFSPISWWNG